MKTTHCHDAILCRRPTRQVRSLPLLLTGLVLALTHTAKADTPDFTLPMPDTSAEFTLPMLDTSAAVTTHHKKSKSAQPQNTPITLFCAPITGESIVAANRGQNPVSTAVGLSPFPIGIRLGMAVSPRSAFDVGADISFPQAHLGGGLTPRVDGDALIADGRYPLYDLTAGLTYGKGIISGQRIYFGGGVGPYFGDVTRFGGKIILGINATSRFGAEANLHFPGFGDPIVTLQARFRM